MKKIILYLIISIVVSLCFCFKTTYAKTPDKPYTTVEVVQGMIAEALAPVNEALTSISNKIQTIESTISSLIARVTILETNTPPTSKILKTFDANGVELGICMETMTVFYPPLERLMQINKDTGMLATDNIFYSEQNCTGNAYVGFGDRNGVNRIITADNSRFYIFQPDTPNESVSLNSYTSTSGVCSNLTAVRDYKLLTPISLPFSFPIPMPLHYKYE